MKTSSQTLMLGILMGLFAWVADAVISWLFSAGEPFRHFLVVFDPEKTLYIRSVVVMLFFIFGLVAGQLIYRLEMANLKEKRQNQYLQGIRAIHRIMGKINEEATLCEQLQLEMKAVFQLQEVCIHLVDPQPMSQPISEQERESFRKRSGCDLPGEAGIAMGHLSQLHEDCLYGVIGFQEQRLGFYCIHSRQFKEKPLEPRLRVSLENLMSDLAQAVVRIRGHAVVEETAEKLQALYRNAPVGIFSSTISGRLLFLNDTMARYLGGADAQEILAKTESADIFYSAEHDRSRFLAGLKQTGEVSRIRNPIRSLDGRLKHLVFFSRLTGREVDDDQVIESFVIDETKSLEMERRNRKLEENLVKARQYESIAGLAAGVAHEFNNILQAMMGSAYLVQMGMEKGTSGWDYLQDIQDSGNRAGRLCDQMLTYAGKKAVLLREEAMDDVMSAFRVLFKADLPSGVGFRMNLEGDGARARVDRASFSELVRNLVVNAAEAIGEEGGEITLYSCTEPLTEGLCQRYGLAGHESDEPYWTLRVRDTGDGMGAETLRRVFDPFFSTKFQGRGLGLAAAKGAVEKFDGELGVCSRPGLGTEFLVALPVSVSVEVVEEAEEVSASAGHSPAIQAGGVVWVVDDEPLICETMRRFIVGWGLQCEVATDSIESVERMQAGAEEMACLILDVTMPGMDGVEVMQEVRKFRPDVPVILMSGFSEEETLGKFQGLELAGFIHKPFQASVLEHHIRRVLEPDATSG